MKTTAERRKSNKKNEKGFAMLEALTFLFVFVVLTAYVVDFFTVIHTGIVNSIAARTYLFETLQHRSNIVWLRAENEKDADPHFRFDGRHERMHALADEDSPQDDTSTHAPGRRLTQAEVAGANTVHSTTNLLPLDNPKNKATTIYIKTGYGICVDAQCPPGS